MLTDCLGQPVTLEDPSSISGLNDFVEGFIASEARAANLLSVAAHDRSPIIQACAAALHLFAESAQGPVHAQPFLERALASPVKGTVREQRFALAIQAWAVGDTPGVIRLLAEQLQEHPRDLVALKLAHYHLFNIGDAPAMLRLALAALPAASDIAYLHGMAAFAWEQCHLLEQAEAAARRAIAIRRKEPWAHHALAHVMLTQGRLREGQAFMAEVSDTWTDLNSFMVTHNWWHQALFALELGDHDTALALYDQQVWGVVKEYSQDQINAVSLLARLELAGVAVGEERWTALGHYLASRLNDHVLPFLDMQYLYGLARAGRPEADCLMRNMEAHARQVPSHAQVAWQGVCLPASRGLLAYARGDFAHAVDSLAQALPQLARIGGSHAQRDLFAQVHLDAMVRSGQLVGAQQLLAPQINQQRESVRLKRQAAGVYTALGLGCVASSFF